MMASICGALRVGSVNLLVLACAKPAISPKRKVRHGKIAKTPVGRTASDLTVVALCFGAVNLVGPMGAANLRYFDLD